jgi:hypothetical protein
MPMADDEKRVNGLVGEVGKLTGRLDSLETNFATHREEMRTDIKDGFKDLNKTLNGRMDEVSGRFDRRIAVCANGHEKQLKQAHGRMKGLDEKIDKQDQRLGGVEMGQGKLVNWKHWALGIGGGIMFLLIVLPPAIKTLIELFGG